MKNRVLKFSDNNDEEIIAHSKYFDAEWYCRHYNIPKAMTAQRHYLEMGWKMGFDPCLYFSTQKYLNINSDVKETNPLLHYEKFGKRENRNIGHSLNQQIVESIYFDEKWYRSEYGINENQSAFWHYMNNGWKRLQDPSSYFSTAGYLYAHSDVAISGQNPLAHYEVYGKAETPVRKIYTRAEIKDVLSNNRRTICESDLFDDKWYHETYKLDEKIDGALHYLVIGSRLQYSPSKYFSEIVYKKFYNIPYYECALLHFEQYGKYYPCNTYIAVENLCKNGSIGDNYFNFIVDKNAKNALRKDCLSKIFRHHTESVDIIICVYNAYEDVKKCIESVFAFTSDPYRLIIVDDNSAELTQHYLESVAQKNSKVLLIRNTSDNHGYTYAANIGLRASTADYNILLNSDTIVSEHWVDNMIKCAIERNAGLVGPLSNTASWQSIPKLTDDDGDWCHNVLPDGLSVHMMAKMIEDQSERLYPIVPLLNGFCMLVTRKTIDMIGYFDEENFGRGFAEEDDYTSRAGKNGIKLAIADDTYIFHAQSKSYSDEKRLALCKISGERLREKHGQEYIESCCKVMYSNYILDSIRERTKMELERIDLIRKGRTKFAGLKILFLLPTSNASGGSNVIIQEAKAMIKMGVDVQILNLKQNKDAFESTYSDLNIPVHYQDNFKINKKFAKAFDVICGSLYSTVKYITKPSEEGKIIPAYYVQDYEPYFFENSEGREWKKAVESYTLIPNCILLTKTKWNASVVFSNTGARCNVIGPSVNVDIFKPRKMFGNTNHVQITAMLRPSTSRRGPEMTYRVLREISKKYVDKVEVNFFGCDAYQEYETALFFNRKENDFKFTNYGILTPQETSLLLAKTDIFVDFSIFQAMGMTAMEAMACGCATILTKYGGVTDFAVNGENALLVDTKNYETCLATVDMLVNNSDIRNYLAQNAYRSMCNFYPEKSAYNILTLFNKRLEERDQ